MQTILLPLDFSPSTDPVLAVAAHLAGTAPSRIVLVHAFSTPPIVDPYAGLIEEADLAAEESIRHRLDHIRSGLQDDGIETESRLLFGPAGPSVVDEAKRIGADWIILGSEGHGALHNLLIGSTVAHVLRHAPCPVLVVPLAATRLPQWGPRRGATAPGLA